MKFHYKAKQNDGSVIEGDRESSDRFQLSHDLIGEGVVPLFVQPVLSKSSFSFGALNEMFIRIKLYEKIIFAKNLGAMLSAGLSLSRSLEILEKQTQNIKLKRIIKSLQEDVSSGQNFSGALNKYPNVFSSVFVAMVGAGEESGDLAGSLAIVAEQLEKTYAIRKKVSSAMIYPTIVVIAMLIIGALMLIYVVPSLMPTFKDFGVELPWTTRIIIGSSDFLVAHIFSSILVVFILIFSFYNAINTVRGQRIIDYIILKLPLISNIVREINSATTARTISSLISSGVNMVKTLEITENVLQNSYYKEVMAEATISIQKGDALSAIFKKNESLYPILVSELALVGEETGKLSGMMMNIAVFYENEVDSVMKDLSTVIEPIIMLFIGGAVGFFAVSMIQPIYALSGGV